MASFGEKLTQIFDGEFRNVGKGVYTFNKPQRYFQMSQDTAFANGTDIGEMTPELADKKDQEKMQLIKEEEYWQEIVDILSESEREFCLSVLKSIEDTTPQERAAFMKVLTEAVSDYKNINKKADKTEELWCKICGKRGDCPKCKERKAKYAEAARHTEASEFGQQLPSWNG